MSVAVLVLLLALLAWDPFAGAAPFGHPSGAWAEGADAEDEASEGNLMDRFSRDQKDVINLLRRNRQSYGDDAAILQGLLLVHAIHGDAILATECGIEGFEENDGKRYVAFRLASGIVFNDEETDRRSRLERVWSAIVERTLLRYPSFSVPADGISIVVDYHHRPYASVSELYETIDEPGPREEARFYFGSEDLAAFLRREIDAQAFIRRSTLFLDGRPYELELREPIEQFPPLPPELRQTHAGPRP